MYSVYFTRKFNILFMQIRHCLHHGIWSRCCHFVRYPCQRFICNFSAAAAERLTKRFPNYEVRIGSGLHVGWAIEGAIGSNRKIDASYLSPHVNFTEFLESSTKEYGVPLLFSEAFYRFLSPQAKKYCRQVGGMIIKSFSLLIFIMIDSQLSY